MITLIIGLIIGVFLGWKYELAINDFINSIKTHLNIKQTFKVIFDKQVGIPKDVWHELKTKN